MVSRLVKPAVASTPLSLQGRKGGPNMGTVLDCWEQTETAQTPVLLLVSLSAFTQAEQSVLRNTLKTKKRTCPRTPTAD